jgi:hypothetical protein
VAASIFLFLVLALMVLAAAVAEKKLTDKALNRIFKFLHFE